MDDEIKKTTLIDHAMQRPSMYVGVGHLDLFQAFVCGVICANPAQEWNEFENWVMRKHYKRNHSSLRCCGMIAIHGKFGWKKRGMKELQRLWNKYKTTLS